MKKYRFVLSILAITLAIGLYLYPKFFASDGEFCLFSTTEYDSGEKEWKAKNVWVALRASETRNTCKTQSDEVFRSMLNNFKNRCESGLNLESWMTPSECKELLKKERMVTIFDVTSWGPANQAFESCMNQHGFNQAPQPKQRVCNGIGW